MTIKPTGTPFICHLQNVILDLKRVSAWLFFLFLLQKRFRKLLFCVSPLSSLSDAHVSVPVGGGKYAVPCHSPLPFTFLNMWENYRENRNHCKNFVWSLWHKETFVLRWNNAPFEAITRASHPLPSFKEPKLKISRITPERCFQKQLRLSHRFAFEITYTIQFACSDPQTKRSDSGIWLKHVHVAQSMELNRIELFFAQTLCWSSVKSLFASFFQQCVVLKSYSLWLYVTYRLW